MALSKVQAWSEPVMIPTYEPGAPDKNPMFLEKRVYQGSSGRIYPLPFYDRIAEAKTPRQWQALHIENEFIYAMILPEIGGRIHVGRDKTNGYDFFYRQNVIKPALVGLAGPWCSGGVEFNWPQHHRPGTFMPVDWQIESHADGSQTIWLSDHDPMTRMKGMHGVCLHPGKSYLELKVRVFNRTPFRQTFLWWANVATRVHEQYQSFFPPDVYYVADHAKRAMSEYPLCQGRYYGVDYGARARDGVPERERPAQFIPPATCAPNDLSWYANIPVPTSYMCMGSQQDFFGGYDHSKRAGVVHVANHHIAPGKKQWTWGNQEFGYAWDRNLTDEDGPYIELMAGVFTDNQPDFSFLMPRETRTWSQYWYPIREIGPAQQANREAAISLVLQEQVSPRETSVTRQRRPGQVRVGLSVSGVFTNAQIRLESESGMIQTFTRDLSPDSPWVETVALPKGFQPDGLRAVVSCGGREIISYHPEPRAKGEVPPPATEPPPPSAMSSVDELFLTGMHLEQYRHATRSPMTYWREALHRDPLDSRCNNAVGLWHFRRGEFESAEAHFRKAIARLTRRNPNPSDGEAYYNLGLCLRHQAERTPAEAVSRQEQARAAFYKATWNSAWQSAAFHALAELDAIAGEWASALEHLDRSLRRDADNLGARNLKTAILRRLGRDTEAGAVLQETLQLDPLDPWARWLANPQTPLDAQTRLDLSLDWARAGFLTEAVALLHAAGTGSGDMRNAGTAPLIEYYLGWLQERLGNPTTARAHYQKAAQAPPDYCFPARLEEIAILEAGMQANPADARAPYYLGNLLYDRRRHNEAIALWERATKQDQANAVAWRNLGIGYFNIRNEPAKARTAYDRAFRANPDDPRVLFERDQLWKHLGIHPQRRLRELEKRRELVDQRDDLSVEICALWNQTGEHTKPKHLLASRKFQPWEGGEGQALGQHVRTYLALGRGALSRGDVSKARELFEMALRPTDNLGEANHLLANQSDIYYWLGRAHEALGDKLAARRHWTFAAELQGDFEEMRVRTFSEMTYYSARALERLGRKAQALKLWRGLLGHAKDLEGSPAQIDYFATSLPAMLLFEDDLPARQTITARFMRAQALLGLGRKTAAQTILRGILRSDPNHGLASDLLREVHG